MRGLLILILLVSITLTGCTSVKTYTFKKDRVDQDIEGNRGYIIGTPPPAPIRQETSKRTLIGIDMEVDILPGEKKGLPPSETVIYEEKSVSIEKGMEKPTSVETEEVEIMEEPERVEEEEWIK